MKVLFAGWRHPRMIAMAHYLDHAFDQLGYTVKQFNYRQYRIPGIIRDRVPYIQALDLKHINNKLIAEAKEFRPDVLFVLQGETIFPETALTIKKMLNIPTVNWFIDFPDRMRAQALNIARGYDFFFAASSTMVSENHAAGNKHVSLMPFGCDPATQQAVSISDEERKQYAHDIVFVGSHHPERETVLRTLVDEFDVGIWGPGWETSKLKEHIRGGLIYPQEWRKIYSSAKIVLNIHYGFTDTKINRISQATCRVFEILCCGAFELTDDTPDIRALFEPGKHLETYSSIDELKNKICMYLKDTTKREAIARAGRDEVLAKHTYVHRLKEIFSLIEQSKGKRPI